MVKIGISLLQNSDSHIYEEKLDYQWPNIGSEKLNND
jgi:hypothetical protein